MGFLRMIQAVLGRPWAPRVFGIAAVVFLAVGAIGRLEGWPSSSSLLEWGAISTVIALGAWAMNRD
jgi:hypothetical protein